MDPMLIFNHQYPFMNLLNFSFQGDESKQNKTKHQTDESNHLLVYKSFIKPILLDQLHKSGKLRTKKCNSVEKMPGYNTEVSQLNFYTCKHFGL